MQPLRPVRPARPQLSGAKGASAPYEASDTLRSTQRAEVVDLLSEGQIGGLVNGLKSIYLDGVPVQNADGSLNFPEFSYRLTLGGPTSEGEHAFGDVQTEVGVGVTVLAAVPVVRTISDTAADSVRVTLTVPQLQEQTENGDRVGASVAFAIDIQSNGGGYVERHVETINGKASSPYSRAVRLSLTDVGPPPWDVRVRRTTADSESASLVNAIAWASYTVISGVKMLYRNSAVMQLTFDARNFSAIPSRWYDLLGISDWDYPVNYDPLTRTVDGTWNGLWQQGCTNNPAWVLWNLVKHPRYGLGQYVTQLPDKWTLYALSLWCDEPLPDGRGGTEPRYSVNVWVIEQQEALRLLQEICAVFRGVLMHGGASLTVTWDAPGEPVASYTPANVVDGLFTYIDGSSAARKTSCTCWYTDRSQAAKREAVTWDDAELVQKYGLRNFEIKPIGVATPAQALRMAKWALYTAHHEEQRVAFRVGAEGPVRMLGEVFQIADPAEAGERLGGRIHAATTTVVELDAPVVLASGETYTLWVTQPHASDPARLVLEGRTVTTAAGTVATLTVSPAFSAAPVPQTVWLLEGSDVAPTLWRYVSIVPVTAEDGAEEYEVLGVAHQPGKWDLIEQDQPLSPRPTRRLPFGAPPVESIDITETVYVDPQGNARIRATVSWPMPAPGLRYVVAVRVDFGSWTTLAPTSLNTLDFDDVQPGLYEVQVQSLNALDQLSAAVTQTALLLGNQVPPPDIEGLDHEIMPAQVVITWDSWTDDLDDLQVVLRYGATLGESLPLWTGVGSDYKHARPANGTYRVWAAYRNRNKIYSAEWQFIDITVDDSIDPGEADQLYIEYSEDGATDWHETFTAGDLYTRWRLGTTGDWEGPWRIVGEDGSAGEYFDFRFRRSATQPATPTGDTPASWFDAPPAPDGTPLWTTIGRKTAAGSLIGTWSTPRQIEGAAGDRTAVVYIYRRAATSPPLPSNTTTYTFATGLPTGMNNSWSATVPSGTDPLWVSAATATGVAAAATDTIASGEWATPSIMAQDGLKSATVFIYRRTGSASAPALPSATATYTFDPPGITGLNNSWVSAVPDPAGGAYLWVSTATALGTGSTDNIASGEWATARLLAQDGGTGQTGQSNHRVYRAVTIGSPPSTPSNTTSGATPSGWSATPLTLSAGQEQYQSDGTTPAGSTTTTWSTPYPSYLKVGSLSAITANLGTVTAGDITGTATIAITGSAVFDGVNSAITVQTAESTTSKTMAVRANYAAGSAAIAYYGRSTASGGYGMYAEATGANGVGLFGYGPTGVLGKAASGGVGVAGYATGSASAGIYGRTNGNSNDGGLFETGGVGGGASNTALRARANNSAHTALAVEGGSTFSARITSTLAGTNVPLVLPVVSSKPTAVAGGVCLHNTLGLIVSDGTNWYGPSGGLVVV